ncbi:unnamed protein product [Moneuplotes crassus]|uniref:Uncharacterized protein n=1 Tax=Euplotes crassus TaxID=5936 RepID=A0AAD1X7K7_EUPCR|nr:unnamed protein product [Moneuplotes crassus]
MQSRINLLDRTNMLFIPTSLVVSSLTKDLSKVSCEAIHNQSICAKTRFNEAIHPIMDKDSIFDTSCHTFPDNSYQGIGNIPLQNLSGFTPFCEKETMPRIVSIDHQSVVLRDNSSSNQSPEILSATQDFSDDVIFKLPKNSMKQGKGQPKIKGNIIKPKNEGKGSRIKPSAKWKSIIPPRKGKITSDKREDVLYKILIRAVKRFYYQKCCGENHLITHLSKKDETLAFDKIDAIVNERFSTYSTVSETSSIPSISVIYDPSFKLSENTNILLEIKVVLASIIIRKNMKKYINRCNLRRICEKYYQIIYKYSYKRLGNLLNSRSIKLIFLDFFKSEDFKSMLEVDESLERDKEAYEYRAQRIVKYITQMESQQEA